MKLTPILARQGNPAITEWCPTCEARMVPMTDGSCGFCTSIPYKPMPVPARREPGDPLKPGTLSERVYEHIQARGATSAHDLVDALAVSYETARHTIGHLRRLGKLERVGEQPSSGPGRSRLTYGAVR